jgi:LytS/YehU family sensor histidine kinase
MLRLTLRSSRLSEIPLAEELKITCLYLDLMRWRFENKLQVHYAIDPETNQCLVPQLILQPLLENSLKHGMKPDGTALEIHLGAHLQDVSLVMRVRDNGVGYHKSALTREGLGLDNVQGRLVQLYGDAHEFSIVNRGDGGTDIRIRIPLRQSLPEKSELA